MSTFAYELAALIAAQQQAYAGPEDAPYSAPWYLVVGEPRSGRTTTIKALNLSWPRGDAPLTITGPQTRCTYWMPEKAVFIEPGPQLFGPNRDKNQLYEFCNELKVKRPREPLDGIVLVVNLQLLADADERAADDYAKSLRAYLIQIAQGLGADIPTYVVATGLDTLWGFGDVFQWTADRRDEDPWGFSLPLAMPASQAGEQIEHDLEGLRARIESMCFAKLSTEEPSEIRIRAFQHLVELRAVLDKFGECMKVIAMGNAFERAPWLRAMVIGSGIPGTGNQLRYNTQQYQNSGLYPPPQAGTPQPGGIPLHALLDNVLLPERDLVPTRTRWRDDTAVLVLSALGVVAWLGVLVTTVVKALV